MVDAAIFDLDGTLIELPIDYDTLFRRVAEIMKKKSVRPFLETIRSANRIERECILRIWDKVEREAIPYAIVNSAVLRIYKEYEKKPRVLVTMQGQRTVDSVLKCFDLSFDFCITRELSLDRTEQLMLAIKKLNLAPERIIFVGNEEYDQRAAEKAGCQFRRVGERKSGTMPLQENM